MSCHYEIVGHVFKTIGQFDGEDVVECGHCLIRLVGFRERWCGKPVITADMKSGVVDFDPPDPRKLEIVALQDYETGAVTPEKQS